ncbi:hypothetical protein TVNIR_1490 [Thioalkalivibrio nitratireducens DSM 14787]|uniref:Uncharacterized protein n=1 Tax=Thioalkalivibrio nitratireducens (strain DSM 14787 / UNIQEM 213 / ALEN2) TaxID=1255043 RepID=L0DW03_THIND|nr:hypothetical protein TVNIR_1490 [Thioalkalivibrio nitratireducens DSM 14787]
MILAIRQNDFPDEEGIKTAIGFPDRLSQRQNDFPDEEGIKTAGTPQTALYRHVRTTSLMKKGLRQIDEGRLGFAFEVRTTSLMKKGLRLFL